MRNNSQQYATPYHTTKGMQTNATHNTQTKLGVVGQLNVASGLSTEPAKQSFFWNKDDQKGMWKDGTFCTLYVHFMLYLDWNSWYYI